MAAPLLWIGLVAAAAAEPVRVDVDGHARGPVWSPNGRFLTFAVDLQDGGVGLFVARITAEEVVDVERLHLPAGPTPDVVGTLQRPAFHPEGTMVFEGGIPGGVLRLWYRTGDGGASAELVPRIELPSALSSPAMSSDGSRLVFVAEDGDASDLWVRETPTGRLARLTQTASVQERSPQFDPTGGRVAFSRQVGADEDIYAVEVVTGAEVVLVDGPGDQTRPIWTADGALVYFARAGEADRWDLVALRDGRPATLAEDVRLPLTAPPAVSPDGRWVAFVRDAPARCLISLVSLDGAGTVEIERPYVACAEPALGAQGPRTMLAFTALPASGADWRFPVVTDVTASLPSR